MGTKKWLEKKLDSNHSHKRQPTHELRGGDKRMHNTRRETTKQRKMHSRTQRRSCSGSPYSCTHRICRSPFGVVSAGACDEESDRQTKQTGFRRSSPTFTTDWILESSSRNLGTNTTLFSDYLMQMETSAILFSHFLRADPEVCTMTERSPWRHTNTGSFQERNVKQSPSIPF